jgi:hypothetical protein
VTTPSQLRPGLSPRRITVPVALRAKRNFRFDAGIR